MLTTFGYNVGMDIKYETVRSKRRTLSITVRGGRVTVRAPMELCDGEIKRIVEKHALRIERMLREEGTVTQERLSKEDEDILFSIAQRELLARLEHYSKISGLKYERARISRALCRFGSCSSKKTVALSCYTLLYPERARDLVAVHELCHLVYMDHSKDFYKLLSSILPDHKERRALLKGAYRRSIEDVKEEFEDFFK